MRYTYVRRKGIKERQFDDGTAVFDGRKVFIFRGISEIIWDFIELPQNKIEKTISETLKIPEGVVKKDLKKFFHLLLREKLISIKRSRKTKKNKRYKRKKSD